MVRVGDKGVCEWRRMEYSLSMPAKGVPTRRRVVVGGRGLDQDDRAEEARAQQAAARKACPPRAEWLARTGIVSRMKNFR